jgi:hypothetical protein
MPCTIIAQVNFDLIISWTDKIIIPQLKQNISHKIYETESSRDNKGSSYGKHVDKIWTQRYTGTYGCMVSR